MSFHMGSSLAKLEATKRGTDGQSLPPAVKPWTISQKKMLPSLICWLMFPSIMKHCRDFTRHPIWPNLWNRVLPSCITALQMRSNELSKISVFQHLPDFTSKIHQNLTLSCKHFASSTLSHLPYSKAHIELLRGILSGEGQDSQFAPRVFAQETGHIQHLSIHLRGRMPVGIVGTLPQRTPKSSTFPGWIFW